MAGSGIPARGLGNGSPKAPPFNSETGREAGIKSQYVQQKMREWRKANPDAPLTMKERDRLHREVLRERMPEVLDAAIEVAKDNTHPDFKILAPFLIKQDMGNPKQAVEMSGRDGEPLGPLVQIYLPNNGRDETQAATGTAGEIPIDAG